MPIKVLSINGWCRNGSTIIGNVLGEVPGFVHVGELHFLWKNGAGKGVNSLCGCGKVLAECPTWSPILTDGIPDGMSPDEFADEVIRRQRAWVRSRHTWKVLRRGVRNADMRAHADLMTRTYQQIAAATGAEVIVDSTKISGEAALLSHLDGVIPYYLHLVRDPRAAAQSWREPKQYVYTMSATKSTWYWRGFNISSNALVERFPERSMFLRYEDFIADPATVIGSLMELCGADPAGNPVRGHTVDLRPNHTVTGNPDRFRSGPTVIRDRDDSWKTKLPRRARLATSLWSWPMAGRYGYGRDGYRPVGIEKESSVGSGA